MQVTLVPELINKQDNFEIIRDQIASILALEVQNQMSLATSQALDPQEWNMKIYSERAFPWTSFSDNVDKSPIVNVSYDGDTTNEPGSNLVDRTRVEGKFNIDVYGYGVNKETLEGHESSDEAAARECHRALRLTRNMLMSNVYGFLLLHGLVLSRRIVSRSIFQPQIEEANAEHVLAGQLVMKVDFNEYSPQYEGVPLELISTTTHKAEDGQILVNADYEFPIT